MKERSWIRERTKALFATAKEHRATEEIRSPQRRPGRKRETQKSLIRELTRAVESAGSNTRKSTRQERIVRNASEPLQGARKEIVKTPDKGKERKERKEIMKVKEAR